MAARRPYPERQAASPCAAPTAPLASRPAQRRHPLPARINVAGRICVALVVAILAGVLAQPAAAHGPPGDPSTVPKRIVFPVVGPASFQDDFGAPRAQGGHQANDVLAKWRAPVVAAESGRVRIWNSSPRAGCMLYLYGDSGTTYLYVHLNNDLTKRDDNDGGCVNGVAYAADLEDDQPVEAGQLIGFVGDSGDAAGGPTHVHFEIHPQDKGAISPYRSLRRAHRLLFPSGGEGDSPAEPLTLRLEGTMAALLPGDATYALALDVRRTPMNDGRRFRVKRRVTVLVPADAVVRRKAGRRARPSSLRKAAPGDKIVVWTTPTASAADAQHAHPQSLSAARILLR